MVPKTDNPVVKTELNNKITVNVVGELLKQTSLENEKLNPPRNLYLEQNLDIKYANSFNTAKTTRNNDSHNNNFKNYNNIYNKKTESNTAASSTSTSKFDDLQKPVFTSKKVEDGSNFIEIKQDEDVY